jgi:hypothetical protein
MLYRRSATRWPARMLGLAAITAASLFLAAGSASADTVTFKNTNSISIPDASPGSATAGQAVSQIPVSGVNGTVTKVTAKLTGFTHRCPIDVDVLLVGPQGQSSILMSDMGDCKQATRSPVDLTFDDNGLSGPVPCILSDPQGTVTQTLGAGSYVPTDGSPTTNGGAVACDPPRDTDHAPDSNPNQGTPGSLKNVFALPAPAGPWGHVLSTFNGKDPNGSWRLFVVDQYNGDTGAVNGGWSLDFTFTPPPAPPAPPAPPPVVVPPQTPNVVGPATLATSITKSKQKVLQQGGVLASFTSSIDGNAVITGTVSVPKLSKVYKFKTVKAKVVANNRTTLTVKLPSSGLKAVRKALAKHKKLKAKIKITVTTASGAVTTVSKTITLTK